MKKFIFFLFSGLCMTSSLFSQFKSTDLKMAEEEIIIQPATLPAVSTKATDTDVKSLVIAGPNEMDQAILDAFQNASPSRDHARFQADFQLDISDQTVKHTIEAFAAEKRYISSDSELEIFSDETDAFGFRHIKFKQTYKGVPVYGAEGTLHGLGNTMESYLGRLHNVAIDNVEPSILAENIDQLIKEQFQSIAYEHPENLAHITPHKHDPELIILNHEGEYILVYHIYYHPNIITRKELFIDAHSGKVLIIRDAFCSFHAHDTHDDHVAEDPSSGVGRDLFGNVINLNTWEENGTFFLIDGTRTMFDPSAGSLPNNPVGAIWTIDGNNRSPQQSNFQVSQITSTNDQFQDEPSVSGHFNAGKAYEYFLNTFGRNSINGAGGTVVSIVNVSEPNGNSMGNAFWNGQAIFYGNGDNAFRPLARGLDVAGHEMSHGVVQQLSNLEYFGESGALNESFADIFGAMIDRDDWQIGEDVVRTTQFPSGALRDLSDPSNGGRDIRDLGRGWQPSKYSERFTGQEDNNGVHINSGIPNHAFYLIATDPSVGRGKAEQIFYTALRDYMTRSSQFIDLRAAVQDITSMRYGESSDEFNAVIEAFDAVEIPNRDPVDRDQDISENPGSDFIWATTPTQEGIFLADFAANSTDQIYDANQLSRMSVTDDGQVSIFVDDQRRIIAARPFTSSDLIIAQPDEIWKNAVISRQGDLIAAITNEVDPVQGPEIIVFNLASATNGEVSFQRFPLFNPTTSNDPQTSDELQFSDALEFDHSGEKIIYDAFNRVSSTDGTTIEYWDIGIIDVWDRQNDRFTSGRIDKLFAQLPNGVSIGNPTFSKNSRNIIAFDFINEVNEIGLIGMDIETGNNQLITFNNTIGYPNYSRDDAALIYDRLHGVFMDQNSIALIPLQDNKIQSDGDPNNTFIDGGHWGVWWSNGQRVLTDIDEPNDERKTLYVYPSIVDDYLVLSIAQNIVFDSYVIHNADGRVLSTVYKSLQSGDLLDVTTLEPGMYYIQCLNKEQRFSAAFIKK